MLSNPVSFPISHVYRKNKSKLSHRDTYTHKRLSSHREKKKKKKSKWLKKKTVDSRTPPPFM